MNKNYTHTEINMQLIYYWYHNLDEEFEAKINKIFYNKDYDNFMKVFEVEKNKRLPEEAVLYIGENTYFNVPINNRDIFNSITYNESECG